jgi:hypothetical protein
MGFLLQRAQQSDLASSPCKNQNKVFEAEQRPGPADSSRLLSWRQLLFDREEAYRNPSQSLEEAYPAYYQLKYGCMLPLIRNAWVGNNHSAAAISPSILLPLFLLDDAFHHFSETLFPFPSLVNGGAVVGLFPFELEVIFIGLLMQRS